MKKNNKESEFVCVYASPGFFPGERDDREVFMAPVYASPEAMRGNRPGEDSPGDYPNNYAVGHEEPVTIEDSPLFDDPTMVDVYASPGFFPGQRKDRDVYMGSVYASPEDFSGQHRESSAPLRCPCCGGAASVETDICPFCGANKAEASPIPVEMAPVYASPAPVGKKLFRGLFGGNK